LSAAVTRSRFNGAIVTRIEPAQTFWRAEDYHQQYADKHPDQACAL
jgi:peptide-methionine (S)-S-oxide reductase